MYSVLYWNTYRINSIYILIMKTPITPLRMPLDLKAKAKTQAEKEGIRLPQWIYKLMRKELKL